MALPKVNVPADPVLQLAQAVSIHTELEFTVITPDPGKEIFLLHIGANNFLIRIYSSFDVAHCRPQKDPYIHFLLIGKQKHDGDVWHAQRILFEKDQKNNFAISARRAEALVLLMNSYQGCIDHPSRQARPYYVYATGTIVWCCTEPGCYRFTYAPERINSYVIPNTERHFRDKRTIFDPALRAPWREAEPKPAHLQLSFSFED